MNQKCINTQPNTYIRIKTGCNLVISARYSDICNMKLLSNWETLLLQQIITGYKDYFLSLKTLFSSKIISPSLMLNYLQTLRRSIPIIQFIALEDCSKESDCCGLSLSPQTGLFLAYSRLIKIL
jgi:hypothetical protein